MEVEVDEARPAADPSGDWTSPNTWSVGAGERSLHQLTPKKTTEATIETRPMRTTPDMRRPIRRLSLNFEGGGDGGEAASLRATSVARSSGLSRFLR